MSYDLSDDEANWQCPSAAACSLDQQVAFFMQTYVNTSIPANVGYEIGIPAFPDAGVSPQFALPLNMTALQLITSKTQPQHTGAIIWEIFKSQGEPTYATPTLVAQSICNVVLHGNARCNGIIPALSNATK